MDEAGNMHEDAVKRWEPYNRGITGGKNTFFFAGRLDLRRGHLVLGTDTVAIGLHDYNQNGMFDDTSAENPRSSDMLFVDLDGDDLLGSLNLAEMFKLNDVFEIGESRYVVENIHPYGDSVSIRETQDSLTNYYLRASRQAPNDVKGRITNEGELDRTFWDLELTTRDGKPLPMRSLEGRYVLLDFWGEWCVGCLLAMPKLVATAEEYPDTTLAIIGLLKEENRVRASKKIKELNMTWPQVLVSGELEERFSVYAYPTKILIPPDGTKYYTVTGLVGRGFLDEFVHSAEP